MTWTREAQVRLDPTVEQICWFWSDEVEPSKRAPASVGCSSASGGITSGQHRPNVKFEKSLVRVPFRILTKDEERLLEKNYKDIRKQVQDAFKQKSN